MLRPIAMSHFTIQVPNRDAPAATRAIAAEGLLHLVDIAHGRTPYDASPPGVRELYASFRDIDQRIRTVCQRLGIGRADPEGTLEQNDIADFDAERVRLLAILEPVEQRVKQIERTASEARDRVARLRETSAAVDRLARASVDINRLLSLRFAAVRLGVCPPDALESIPPVLAPEPHALIPLDETADSVMFAAVMPAHARPRLDEAMRLGLAQPVALPSIAVDTSALRGELASAEDAEASSRKAIDDERAASEESLQRIGRRAEVLTLLLQAQTYFAASGRFVVISGWIPQAAAERLKQRIAAVTSDRAVVQIEAAEQVPGFHEGMLRVPILHRNPLLLRPFQKLVDIYGTQSYSEVEPTAFFAISFLLMFGLMFGDVGHGAVLFLAGWLAFRRLPWYLDYGILLMEAGASSALFGILYGTIFGIRNLIPTLWLEPIDDLPRFMMIAAGFGAIVVTSGLVLNIINTWRSGERKNAMYGPRGITGALLYWVVLVLIARAYVPATFRLASAVVVGALVLAIIILLSTAPLVRTIGRTRAPAVRTTPWWLRALESSIELVDTLFSFFANTISFVRIAAFAAVHCALFLAIFAIADTVAHLRFGGAYSLAVHVAGNAVVILLEGLTVSVQVLRLEYYEFFGKFFRGGGEAYKPLALPEGREGHAQIETDAVDRIGGAAGHRAAHRDAAARGAS